ncbi:MAG: class D beta-lactamase [Alphaproteobacteria bacterium]|nr:class D beta-lactamase [Alphaproteobacteria bacterium]
MKFSLKNFVLTALVSVSLSASLLIAPTYGMDPTPEWTKCALIVKQKGESIMERGKCDDPHAPYSTFKVALALMGFDAEILQDKDSPELVFINEDDNKLKRIYPDWYTLEIGEKYHWRQAHTPETYMKNSVIWYSFRITQALGKEKFQEYVSKFHYGNEDISGTPDKDDGLLKSWLGTSLEISPRGQVEFLENLFVGNPMVSKDAQEKTREIMDRDEEWNGWRLYGKTGGGAVGWFIGWVEKKEDRVFFAQYIDGTDQNLDQTGLSVHETAGLKAKEVAKRHILKLLPK